MAMQSLVTRFHLLLLLLTVTTAITGVAFLRVPADFAYPAHLTGSMADWVWPRHLALSVAPIAQILLLVAFFLLGRAFTKNQFSKSQHILDPALTLLLLVIAACQLGLLLTGTGSDLDLIRLTSLALGATLVGLGIVLFEAERHTYAGLRMPWPIAADRAWTLVHRTAGLTFGAAGLSLLALAWFDVGTGPLIAAFALAIFAPAMVAGLVSLLTRR